MIPRGVLLVFLGSLATACGASTTARPSAATAFERERAACAEVPDADRDAGPFAQRDRIVRVEPLRQTVSPKAPAPVAGVAVYVRAAPGMTEQWLGRVIECHVAHGTTLASSASDPLLVPDARIAVTPTPTEFRIAITSDDGDEARRILIAGSALATN
jgi:hypothetical protein